jgi:hypothetical protein
MEVKKATKKTHGKHLNLLQCQASFKPVKVISGRSQNTIAIIAPSWINI